MGNMSVQVQWSLFGTVLIFYLAPPLEQVTTKGQGGCKIKYLHCVHVYYLDLLSLADFFGNAKVMNCKLKSTAVKTKEVLSLTL